MDFRNLDNGHQRIIVFGKKSPKKVGTAQRHMKRYFKRRVLEYVIMIQEWDYELSVDRSTQKNINWGYAQAM